MGNERQAHLGVWSGDGVMIDTYQPPLAEEANDPKKQLATAIEDATNFKVIPIGVTARISGKGNVVISWETIDGKTREEVLRVADVKDFLFDKTKLPVSVKFKFKCHKRWLDS